MRILNRISQYLLLPAALLAVSFSAAAYEVHILSGEGSESKALDKGKYELAIKRLERRTAQQNPHIDIQLTNLCTAYVATNRLEKARDVCDRAVEAEGDFVGTAYNSRGVLNALKGDYIAAMVDFDNAGSNNNYPVARKDYGDRAPSMRRFNSPDAEATDSMQIAARNHAATDRTWAAIQQREAVASTEGTE